jgi:hypothetical protein
LSSTTTILFATWLLVPPTLELCPYAFGKSLTIIRKPTVSPDPHALALAAVGWAVSDDARAQRLLALTGLSADALRQGLGDRAVLAAVLDFLAGHEADLVAAASALDVEPAALVTASEALR